jgi:hypothetical protein
MLFDDRIVVACRLVTADPHASPKIGSRERMEDSIEETTDVENTANCTSFQEQESQYI